MSVNWYEKFSNNNEMRLHSHIEELFSIVTNMFTYTGIPLSSRLIERFLCFQGSIGFQMIEGKLECGMFVGNGELGTDGLPTGGYIVCLNGKQGKLSKLNDNLVVAYNNKALTPDYDLFRQASLLNDCDISMLYNVLYSRLVPLPVARTNKQKDTINECINNILNGKITTIIDDNLLKDLLDGQASKIETVELTKPENVQNLQFLSKYYDDILRRVCTRYGQPMQTTGKMAQLTTEEIQGYSTYSQITPHDKKECREEMVQNLNKVFGLNASVKLSVPFRVNEYTDKEADSENIGVNDNE